MSRLEEMSVEEILDYLGMYLTSDNFKAIVGYNREAIDKLFSEIEENQKRIKNGDMLDRKTAVFVKNTRKDDEERLLNDFNTMTFRNVLNEYESKVNKSSLAILTLYNIQHNIEINDSETMASQRKILIKERERAMALLGKSDKSVITLAYKKKEDSVERVNVLNSRELIRCIKSNQKLSTLMNLEKKKMTKIEEIDRKVGIGNLTRAISVLDLKDIACVDPEIGSAIVQQMFYNFLREYKKTHPDMDITAIEEDGTMTQDMLASEEYNESMIQSIKSNCKYIDIDKLLLIAAFRYIEILENGNEDEVSAVVKISEEEQQLTQVQTLGVLIGLIEREIKRDVKIDNINMRRGEIAKYSLSELKEDMCRFTKDRYIKKSDCEELKQRLIAGEITLKTMDESEARFIKIDGDEIVNILNASDDNIFYCIDNNIIKKDDIYDLLTILDRCSKEVFAEMVRRRLLEIEEIEKLFNEGIIGAEHIKAIEDDEVKNSINIVDKLRKLYMTVSNPENETTPEERALFIKYVELYKALNIEGRSEEEVQNASFNLISSFEEDIDSHVLQELYQYGLITLEDAADWGVDLKEMLSSNSIKPTDLKELYAKKVIDIDSIRNVIVNNDDLPYEEKLDLIYSTFDGETEEEYAIREELVQLLEEKDSYKAESNGVRSKSGHQSKPKSKEYVTDPHARWKLISLLDKDYSKKFLPAGKEVKDGHRVFLLPNQNNIVIERMHERKRGKKVSAYANATYVMETDEFFKNMDEIIIDGAINRSKLRELSESDMATRIIHSKGWGTSIKNYFGIEEDNSKYTKEEIEEIDKAIEGVNKSRKERT